MTSRVQIWNMALTHLGHKANIQDPDQQIPEASHCRMFYDAALRVTLERYNWKHARRRIELASVTNPVAHYGFAYAVPANCVTPRKLVAPESTTDESQDFDLETDSDGNGIILTNVEDAVLIYTAYGSDESKFSPMFAVSLSYDLAAFLVGPIPKDPKMKQSMLNAAALYALKAAEADANAGQSSSYRDFVPASVKARFGA